MRVHTSFVYPPIPVRDMDWQATCDEYEDTLAGHGASEQQAIEDLMQQIEELESQQ